MLRVMPQSRGNFLAVEVFDALTDRDYRELFIPEMDAKIKEHGKIDVLFVFHDTHQKVEWGAIWDDCLYGLKHRKDFNRVAIVGGPKWISWFEAIGNLFTTSSLRFFPHDGLVEALDWVHPEAAHF